MVLVEPLWMSGGKRKAGHREFRSIFHPFYKKDLIVGWYYNV
jgi:hypothetical protein